MSWPRHIRWSPEPPSHPPKRPRLPARRQDEQIPDVSMRTPARDSPNHRDDNKQVPNILSQIQSSLARAKSTVGDAIGKIENKKK